MFQQNLSIIFTFIFYFVFMLGIGAFFYSKSESLSDYVLGGRSLNGWVTSLSAQASDMSGWLLLGLPGAAYISGVDAAWIAIGLFIGTYLNWKFVAKRLRNYTQIAGDSITLSDYFENRFRDRSKLLRIISAVFILFFFLIYTASGFVAGGKLFNTVFGLPYIVALTIGAAVVIGYTFLGGFMAVCWTDFFQGVLMLIALLFVPLTAVSMLGGFGSAEAQMAAVDPSFLKIFESTGGEALLGISIISSLAWGLGYFGQPHILARFMAIRSAEEIKKARVIAVIWVFVALGAAVFVGMIGRVYLTTPLDAAASETVFMMMVGAIFNPVVAGVLLAAILAAIMSTADSQLLVTSSAITEDFYKAFIRKEAKDKELIWVSRLTVVGVAIVAYILALDPDNSVMGLVSYAWAGFGAAFGPTIILSLYWKRMTRNGALAGMIVGGIMTVIWKGLSGGIFDLYEIVPAFFCSVIAIIIFSLLEHEPTQEMIEEFDSI